MQEDIKDKIPRFFVMIIILVSVIIISGGIIFYKTLEKRTVKEKQNELAAIATLKAGEVTKWRTEHVRDGFVISRNLPLIKSIREFVTNKSNEDRKAELLNWMQAFIKEYDYQGIFLLDTTRTIRLAYPGDVQITGNPNIAPASDVKDLSDIYFSDLHRSPDISGIHLDLVVPLYMQPEKRSDYTGLIVLRIDPETSLFPLIQSWPTQSKTSETILLRRDGDSILYLNELRHRKNTALSFRLPLSNKRLPGSRVVLGYEGEFKGVDYRNVKVFSYLKRIQDSPWFMVTKIDKKEIYSALTEQLVLISLIIILLILSITMILGYTIRSQRVRAFRELNNSKDKFFSIISHDLKAPFVSIVGFSELLNEKIRKSDFQETDKYASIIQESSYSAMNLLSNLIEWSRIQSGRIKTNIQPVDLCRIIDESVILLNAAATHKAIAIVKKIPEKLYILADGVMISTVIRNLISNSIKFSHENSLIIISASDREEDVLTEIKDFGIGIEKPVLEKLFLAESTVSIPGTRNEVGTALGLIICKEFISMHNGRIWAESELGKGSTFTFSIPKK